MKSPLDELIAKLSDDSRYIILCCDNTYPGQNGVLKGEKLIYMVNSDIGLNNRKYIKEIKKIELFTKTFNSRKTIIHIS